MTDERRWHAGVDWASESHHVFLTDEAGTKFGERVFKHSGEGLAERAIWQIATSGCIDPGQLHIAIEVPHGPVVENLIERRLSVYAINPKQMDRFRDSFTLAGAKDDSRDAETMRRPFAPIRAASVHSLPWTRSSSSCASGPASQRTSAPSVFV